MFIVAMFCRGGSWPSLWKMWPRRTHFPKVQRIHEIHPIEGINFMQGGSRPSPTAHSEQNDKLKFKEVYNFSAGGRMVIFVVLADLAQDLSVSLYISSWHSEKAKVEYISVWCTLPQCWVSQRFMITGVFAGVGSTPHRFCFASNIPQPTRFRLVLCQIEHGVHCAHPFDAYFIEGGVLQRLWTRLFLPSLAL